MPASNGPAPESSRPEPGYLAGLDGIRGIAILLVLLYHSAPVVGIRPSALGPLLPVVRMGWAGVDIFFALSGFLITTLLLREEQRFGRFSLKRFYARRALRILPPFYFCLLLFFGVFGRFDLFTSVGLPRVLGEVSPWTPVAVASFLTNYAIAYWEPVSLGGAIHIFWSLCVEEHFYLAWPLALTLLRSPRSRLGVAVLLCIAVCALRLVATTLRLDAPGVVHIVTHYRLDSILWGAVVALLRPRLAEYPWGRRALLAAAWAATLALVATGSLSSSPTPLGHSLGLSLLALASGLSVLEVVEAGARSPVVRILELAPLAAVGRVSYEMYLLHSPALDLGRTLLLRGGPGEHTLLRFLGFAFLLAALAWAFAWAAHEAVGRPALRLKGRWSAAR